MIPELSTNADDEVAMSFICGGNGMYANSSVPSVQCAPSPEHRLASPEALTERG
jgi:hypothetical protein